MWKSWNVFGYLYFRIAINGRYKMQLKFQHDRKFFIAEQIMSLIFNPHFEVRNEWRQLLSPMNDFSTKTQSLSLILTNELKIESISTLYQLFYESVSETSAFYFRRCNFRKSRYLLIINPRTYHRDTIYWFICRL